MGILPFTGHNIDFSFRGITGICGLLYQTSDVPKIVNQNFNRNMESEQPFFISYLLSTIELNAKGPDSFVVMISFYWS